MMTTMMTVPPIAPLGLHAALLAAAGWPWLVVSSGIKFNYPGGLSHQCLLDHLDRLDRLDRLDHLHGLSL
jgi:hypothetical protein